MKIQIRARDGGVVVVLCNAASLPQIRARHPDMEILEPARWPR